MCQEMVKKRNKIPQGQGKVKEFLSFWIRENWQFEETSGKIELQGSSLEIVLLLNLFLKLGIMNIHDIYIIKM